MMLCKNLKIFLFVLFFSFSANSKENIPDFTGVWQTTYGKMRLGSTSDGRLEGIYAYDGLSKITGTQNKNIFNFNYSETHVKGKGWFEISKDGQSFEGEWQQDGMNQQKWQKWSGKRVKPIQNTSWLIVLEADWGQSIEEHQLSFGDMLKTFFESKPDVLVRHRYFSDLTSFQRYLNEVIFLPEPVVLTIAAHGQSDGILTENSKFGPKVIANALSYAANLKLLHFSSCLVMKEHFASDILKELPASSRFPISGYKTTVDWIASAIFEFMYFDLILNRKQSVKEAANTITKLMPFGGTKKIAGAPFSSMNFDVRIP